VEFFVSRSAALGSTNLMKFPKLRTPLAADLEGSTNIRSEFVIATTLLGYIEPRARSIDRSAVLKVSRLGRDGRAFEATKVGCGVFTTNRQHRASIPLEKKWRMSYGQATRAAAIARLIGLGRHCAPRTCIRSSYAGCVNSQMATTKMHAAPMAAPQAGPTDSDFVGSALNNSGDSNYLYSYRILRLFFVHRGLLLRCDSNSFTIARIGR
jgi:hypothetical protein